MTLLILEVWAIFLVLLTLTLSYATLTKWKLTATGKGFLAALAASTLVTGLALFGLNGIRLPVLMYQIALALLLTATGWGILRNLFHQQFGRRRPAPQKSEPEKTNR